MKDKTLFVEGDKMKNQKTEVNGQQEDTKEKSNKKSAGTVTITLPMDKCYSGFATSYVDIRLTPRQAAALKVLWSSLSDRNVRHTSPTSDNPKGRPVENAPSAMRWLLDQMADEIEQKTGRNLVMDYELVFR